MKTTRRLIAVTQVIFVLVTVTCALAHPQLALTPTEKVAKLETVKSASCCSSHAPQDGSCTHCVDTRFMGKTKILLMMVGQGDEQAVFEKPDNAEPSWHSLPDTHRPRTQALFIQHSVLRI